jgi:hypothetical protein
MDEKDLTPWFGPEVKPVRKGWYPRKYLAGVAYSRWNGRSWSCGVFDLGDRDLVHGIRSNEQHLPWRGLAHPPKGA